MNPAELHSAVPARHEASILAAIVNCKIATAGFTHKWLIWKD